MILISLFSVSCSQPIHTVKFNTDGGSAVADQPVEDGKCATRPTNPTKEGFAFDDWYTDTSLSTKYDFNTPVKNDFTLYAKWLQAYAITYVGPEGTVVDYAPSGAYTLKYNSLVSKGTKAAGDNSEFTNFKKQNYSLARWDIDSNLYDEGSEIEIKGQSVTVNCYWVTSGSFTASSTGEVKANGSLSGSLVIPRVVSTWSGSESTDTLVKTVGDFSNKSITKAYIPSSVEKVNDKAFKNCSKLTTVYITSEVPPELGSGAFDGCRNLKQINVPEGSEDAYKEEWSEVGKVITGTDEPTPKPTPTPGPTPGPTPTPTTYYTVSFAANTTAGTPTGMPANQQVISGGKVTEPTSDPTLSGYTFGGWYKEAACTNAWNFANDTVTKNTTLYAKWTAATEPDYLTFSLENSSNPVSDSLSVTPSQYWTGSGSGTQAPVRQYSTFNGTSWSGWTDWTSGAVGGTGIIKIRFRGENCTSGSATSESSYTAWTITSTTSVSCSGNIETILDYKTVASGGHPAISSFCFAMMFHNCQVLSSVDAGLLPATDLAEYCYAGMFRYCINLTTAPALPAGTLADGCYNKMFDTCAKLKVNEGTDPSVSNKIFTYPSGSTAENPVTEMFKDTSGSFTTGTPSAGKTYYYYTPDPYTLKEKDTWFSNFSGLEKSDVTDIVFTTSIPITYTLGPINVAEGSNTDPTKGVVGYYYDDTSNSKKKIYIVAPTGKKVKGNPDSSEMFFYFSNITSLDLSALDTSSVTKMSAMFNRCHELTSLDLSNFDTSKVEKMETMFYECYKLASVDLSSFNTSEVTDMNSMFMHCYVLDSLDLSNFNTSKVTDMKQMFYNCYKLASLNLSSFDTSEVTNMWCMFVDCNKLTSLDLSSFNTSKVTDMRRMFESSDYSSLVSSLVTIYVSNKFDVSNVTQSTDMFSGCKKLVGGNGTPYSSTYKDKTYARIDKAGTPGYFTAPSDPYVLKERDTWFTNFGVAKTSITNIIFTDNISSYSLPASVTNNPVNIAEGGNTDPTKGVVGYYDSTNTTIYIATPSGKNVNGNSDSSYMFSDPDETEFFTSLTSIDFGNLDTSDVTTMYCMFYKCKKLASLNLINFNTASVTNMSYMFGSCGDWDTWPYSGLTEITFGTNFITSEVTNMSGMFYACLALTSLDVSDFSTSKVTNMEYMFAYCESLPAISVNGFITSSVTKMNGMFQMCKNLTSISLSNFDTASVTTIYRMFSGCGKLTSLDLSSFDTAKVTNMGFMFQSCSLLTRIYTSNKFVTSAVTSGSYMFDGCSSLAGYDGSTCYSYVGGYSSYTYAKIYNGSNQGYFTAVALKPQP